MRPCAIHTLDACSLPLPSGMQRLRLCAKSMFTFRSLVLIFTDLNTSVIVVIASRNESVLECWTWIVSLPTRLLTCKVLYVHKSTAKMFTKAVRLCTNRVKRQISDDFFRQISKTSSVPNSDVITSRQESINEDVANKKLFRLRKYHRLANFLFLLFCVSASSQSSMTRACLRDYPHDSQFNPQFVMFTCCFLPVVNKEKTIIYI